MSSLLRLCCLIVKLFVGDGKLVWMDCLIMGRCSGIYLRVVSKVVVGILDIIIV